MYTLLFATDESAPIIRGVYPTRQAAQDRVDSVLDALCEGQGDGDAPPSFVGVQRLLPMPAADAAPALGPRTYAVVVAPTGAGLRRVPRGWKHVSDGVRTRAYCDDAAARTLTGAATAYGALRAILARLDGVFDDRHLAAYGPLCTTTDDVRRIASDALRDLD